MPGAHGAHCEIHVVPISPSKALGASTASRSGPSEDTTLRLWDMAMASMHASSRVKASSCTTQAATTSSSFAIRHIDSFGRICCGKCCHTPPVTEGNACDEIQEAPSQACNEKWRLPPLPAPASSCTWKTRTQRMTSARSNAMPIHTRPGEQRPPEAASASEHEMVQAVDRSPSLARRASSGSSDTVSGTPPLARSRHSPSRKSSSSWTAQDAVASWGTRRH
mmetsp:Transcript_100230/g.311781  ORF Transcript_100230/g.311781 Transcript_100230/m.311781 type:complete len:222 (-) Transcript_100230:47-712(-)